MAPYQAYTDMELYVASCSKPNNGFTGTGYNNYNGYTNANGFDNNSGYGSGYNNNGYGNDYTLVIVQALVIIMTMATINNDNSNYDNSSNDYDYNNYDNLDE